MLVSGIILTIGCIIILIAIGAYSEEAEDIAHTFLITLAFVFGICLIIAGAMRYKPTEKYLKDNTLKIEVRSTFVNGKETKNDTVYIFTPKKK